MRISTGLRSRQRLPNFGALKRRKQRCVLMVITIRPPKRSLVRSFPAESRGYKSKHRRYLSSSSLTLNCFYTIFPLPFPVFTSVRFCSIQMLLFLSLSAPLPLSPISRQFYYYYYSANACVFFFYGISQTETSAFSACFDAARFHERFSYQVDAEATQ